MATTVTVCWITRALVALLTVFLLANAAVSAYSAQRPNGAGVVIRHGDGTLIYAYVQFEADSLSGEELLVRTGLDLTVAPFGGLGSGVCAIDSEGCPAENCYCQSYSAPAMYWQYFAMSDGVWVKQAAGPSSRTIHDGDIDGWSWTQNEPGLPVVTIDEIALLNGVDRNPPTVTLAPSATDAPTSSPVITASPTLAPPTATLTATLTATAPENAVTVVPTDSIRPTATVMRLPTQTSTSIATSPSTATSSPTFAVSPEATQKATSVAVIVTPGATPQPMRIAAGSDDSSRTDLVVFGVVIGVVTAGGGLLALRARRGSSA